MAVYDYDKISQVNEQRNTINVGSLTKVMHNVYLWMTLGLFLTGITAFFVASSATLMALIFSNRSVLWGLIILEFLLVILLSTRLNKLSYSTARVIFLLYAIINGATLASIFYVYSAQNISSAFFITSGTFAVMSIAGYFTQKDLSTMGLILRMSLYGIIIASVVNLFVANSTLDIAINYIAVVVFVGLTAYDTQKIKQMLIDNTEYGSSDVEKKISLFGSLMLYLDFVNLFLRILRIISRRK